MTRAHSKYDTHRSVENLVGGISTNNAAESPSPNEYSVQDPIQRIQSSSKSNPNKSRSGVPVPDFQGVFSVPCLRSNNKTKKREKVTNTQ